MHIELKCSNRNCGEVLQEYELVGECCPYCFCPDLFEREAREDEGYHTNEYGELIPDEITVRPVEVTT